MERTNTANDHRNYTYNSEYYCSPLNHINIIPGLISYKINVLIQCTKICVRILSDSMVSTYFIMGAAFRHPYRMRYGDKTVIATNAIIINETNCDTFLNLFDFESSLFSIREL